MPISVDVMIEGGKATAAPPLGPALGPTGVNIGQVIAEINKKTESMKGMQVPIKVNVNDDKTFSISIGTPPASALIKKEAGVESGAANPLLDKVADIKIEQVIKIAKMKQDSLLGKDNFSIVKEICGTCDSMGIMVEGKQARETIKDINNGKFKDKILAGKTELSAEEIKALEEEKKKLTEEMAQKRKVYEAKAKEIMELMKDRTASQIKGKMREAKIPEDIIKTIVVETAAAPAAGGAAPAGKAAPAKK